MSNEKKYEHFKGKSTEKHLSDINKQKSIISETHAFPKNNLVLFFTSFKNILFYLLSVTLIMLLAFSHILLSFSLLFSLGLMLTLWTSMQKVWQEWSYLELCHRWIQEERKEIDLHLDQEMQELRYIYKHKGFQGKLLDEITNYLSSDSNLLLQSMIEDEFGMQLTSYPHPLQQGCIVFLGGIGAILVFLLTHFLFSIFYTTCIVGSILISLNVLSSFLIKNKKIKSTVWSLAIFIFSIMFSLFIYKIVNL